MTETLDIDMTAVFIYGGKPCLEVDEYINYSPSYESEESAYDWVNYIIDTDDV